MSNGNNTYAFEPKGGYRAKTTEVGSFPPNAFGLYDMHGNVWEWCRDNYHRSYVGAPSGGSPWLKSKIILSKSQSPRMLRGGSWYVNPRLCRSAYRDSFVSDKSSEVFGFRVVVSDAKIL